MDQLANDLSFAIIDVEDINELGLKSELPSRLIPPDGRGKGLVGKDKLINCNSLSSTTEIQKKSATSGSKAKSSKPVLRSASILLRSKKLILSDSESDDGDSNSKGDQGLLGCQTNDLKDLPRPFGDYSSLSRKHRMKKHKRKKEAKEERLFGQLCVGQTNFGQYFGKRKRSTTNNQQQSTSTCSDDIHGSSSGLIGEEQTGNSYEPHSMDCESQSCDSSSLSESVCDSDHFAEADDEQSDFYEVMTRSNKELPKSTVASGCSKPVVRTKYSPSIPIPQNPFASVPPTPSSSYNSLTGASSSILWKRRRRNH